MVHQSNTAGKKPTLTQADQKRILAKANDMSETMFNTIGACFNQLQTPSTNIKGWNCFCMSGLKRGRHTPSRQVINLPQSRRFLNYTNPLLDQFLNTVV